jgi:serine/threonine protein kinase
MALALRWATGPNTMELARYLVEQAEQIAFHSARIGLIKRMSEQRIYAVLKRVIFPVDEEKLPEGLEPLAVIIGRQISFFAHETSLKGLLRHLGENRWSEVFQITWDEFNEKMPRKPFSSWENVDPTFKDLVRGLTNFDPDKRPTAQEALEHEWFEDV